MQSEIGNFIVSECERIVPKWIDTVHQLAIPTNSFDNFRVIIPFPPRLLYRDYPLPVYLVEKFRHGVDVLF